MSDESAIVIDNGSGMIKAGRAGEEAPLAYFPSVVGKPKYGSIIGNEHKDFYVGKDAVEKRGVLALDYPVRSGIVDNWNNMTKVWEHCYYNELRCEPQAQPVHLTEAPKNPVKNREKMTEIFFETFSVPAFYCSVQAVLALYGSVRTEGVVYDSGDGVTHTVPIFDGFALNHGIQRLNLAGRNLTEALCEMLRECGVDTTSSAEKDIVKDIKEKKCYVAMDYAAEKAAFQSDKSKETTYEMPDGSIVTIGEQQIRCPEVLFQPSLIGKEMLSIQDAVYTTVQKCDIDIRRALFQNILLSGGSTMFPNIGERLVKEIKTKVNASVDVKFTAPNERKFTVWMGGSTLCTLATFEQMWVTKGEFEEVGVGIVHRKCF